MAKKKNIEKHGYKERRLLSPRQKMWSCCFMFNVLYVLVVYKVQVKQMNEALRP